MYVSTSDISAFYGVDPRFFTSRKDKGEFKRNIHYIEARDTGTLRWNTEEIHRWWTREDGNESNENEELLEKLLTFN